jgi:hypothetical protein
MLGLTWGARHNGGHLARNNGGHLSRMPTAD